MIKCKRRMPAEWEPQSAVQLTMPHEHTDWAPILPEILAVYEEMKREISKHEPLIIVDDIPHNDTWARDHGFITCLTPNPSPIGEGDEKAILLDFKFNGWGEKFPAELDNEINRHLYERGLVKGIYEPHLDFVLEGGSIESDGKGTIFTVQLPSIQASTLSPSWQVTPSCTRSRSPSSKLAPVMLSPTAGTNISGYFPTSDLCSMM